MIRTRVILKVEAGQLQTGLSLCVQICQGRNRSTLASNGLLPGNQPLLTAYHQWKVAYMQLGLSDRLDPIQGQQTNFSVREDCLAASQSLREEMNAWLRCESFRSIRETILAYLSPTESIQFWIQTDDLVIQRLPWYRWEILDPYPKTTLSVVPKTYVPLTLNLPRQVSSHVQILGVFVDDQALETQGDRQILERLPQAQLTLVQTPTRRRLSDQLWSQSWDIFFFAGHSSSQSGQGQVALDADHWLTLDELQYGVTTAASQGLQLTIFNSCDGLGLAQDLLKHQVPFNIVMREPVPTPVAQSFLAYFLEAYAKGHALDISVMQARQRLESLEDRYPCATELPILVRHPAIQSPSWQDFLDKTLPEDTPRLELPSASVDPTLTRYLRGVVPQLKRDRTSVFPLSLLGLILLFLVRGLGSLQGLELWAFDQLMRHRPYESPDPRLLIVEIDEATLQGRTESDRIGSISDQTLLQLLTQIQQYKPQTIGLDIYRDSQQTDPALVGFFRQTPNLIGVCKSPDAQADSIGVPQPQGLPKTQLGFSDFLEDPDGIVRRQLLLMDAHKNICSTPLSFSAQLAFHFLARTGVPVQLSTDPKPQDRDFVLRHQRLHSLRSHGGGYQGIDARGNQILLNYRALPEPSDIAAKVTIQDILTDQVPAEHIRDRLVLIGVTAQTAGDYWKIPNQKAGYKTPGIFVQAHMVSQLISTAQDHRPLLWVWPNWLEVIWIGAWSVFGYCISIASWRRQGLILVVSLLCLITVCFLILLTGGWIPLVPAAVGLVIPIGLRVIKPSPQAP